MKKSEIIERLLEQGHIVVSCADRILNQRDGYLTDIKDLHRDGPISTKETVVLLGNGSNLLEMQPGAPDSKNTTYTLNVEDSPSIPKWSSTTSLNS